LDEKREERDGRRERRNGCTRHKAVHCFCARDDGIYYGLLVKQPSTSHIPTITLQPNLQIDSLAYSQFSEMVSLDLQTLRAVPTLPASASTTRPTIELQTLRAANGNDSSHLSVSARVPLICRLYVQCQLYRRSVSMTCLTIELADITCSANLTGRQWPTLPARKRGGHVITSLKE
jgi:hypothetical protein